jgi:DNA-binding transcriptional MerR regulator
MTRTILRLEQISERTGVPVATLRYWRHLGIEVPTFRLGRRVVAYADEVDLWVEAKRAQAREPRGAA